MQHGAQKMDQSQVIQGSQEITEVSTLERKGLSVSYGLKTFSGEREKLIRVSLIFRNHTDGEQEIRPRIKLVAGDGRALDAYTLSTFSSVVRARDSASTSGRNIQAYWLKRRYRIPPNGIAIGELVYRDRQVIYPLTLDVQIGRETFEFKVGSPGV